MADTKPAILFQSLKRLSEAGIYYYTYCSIKDRAKKIADGISSGDIKALFVLADAIEKQGYVENLFMDHDVEKIAGLG